MFRVMVGGHFCIPFLMLLGISLAGATFERNHLSLEDARTRAMATPLSSLRIVGGSWASPDQFPHQVALMQMNSLWCGGSLITNKWILTAAHCVYRGTQLFSPSQMSVLAGTVNLYHGGVRRNIRRIIPHEIYYTNNKYTFNDIAVLELGQPFQLSRSIAPITLCRSTVPAGSTVIISGWGRLSHGGPSPAMLKYNQATALGPSQCALEMKTTPGWICLMSPHDNGACHGDSGGPAVYNNELAGIASFGKDGICGLFQSDAYMQVSAFIPWIESKINSGRWNP